MLLYRCTIFHRQFILFRSEASQWTCLSYVYSVSQACNLFFLSKIQQHKILRKQIHNILISYTMCSSRDLFHIVSYYIKWVTTTWTYSSLPNSMILHVWSRYTVSLNLMTINSCFKYFSSQGRLHIHIFFRVWSMKLDLWSTMNSRGKTTNRIHV